MKRLRADFNRLFGDLLWLSQEDSCLDEDGNQISLFNGMMITVFMEDLNAAGARDDLIATGTVERAPNWLLGARWAVRIDARGVQALSELTER